MAILSSSGSLLELVVLFATRIRHRMRPVFSEHAIWPEAYHITQPPQNLLWDGDKGLLYKGAELDIYKSIYALGLTIFASVCG